MERTGTGSRVITKSRMFLISGSLKALSPAKVSVQGLLLAPDSAQWKSQFLLGSTPSEEDNERINSYDYRP